jgi:hypothetical protein
MTLGNTSATGVNLRKNVDDLLCDFNNVKEINKWYNPHDSKVAIMETYGGADNSDLCCLFHSCLKSISVDMQEVSTPYTNSTNHANDRIQIAQSFKENMAAFLFSDLAEGKNQHETKQLADRIKFTYNVANSDVFTGHIKSFMKKHNLFDREQERRFAGTLNPENADEILAEFEEMFVDPRFARSKIDNTYIFPSEIRELPITTGLFSLVKFFEPESDLRSDNFNGAGQGPAGMGCFSTELIIDQLVNKKYHGLAMLDFIAQMTGFNVCLIAKSANTSVIPPIVTQSFNGRPKIFEYIRHLLMTGRYPDHLEWDNDAIPHIVIQHMNSHFQNIGILHEVKLRCDDDVDAEAKSVWQCQTVFSGLDPFIVAIYNEKSNFVARGVLNREEMNKDEVLYDEVDIANTFGDSDHEDVGDIMEFLKQKAKKAGINVVKALNSIIHTHYEKSPPDENKAPKEMTVGELRVYLDSHVPTWKTELDPKVKINRNLLVRKVEAFQKERQRARPSRRVPVRVTGRASERVSVRSPAAAEESGSEAEEDSPVNPLARRSVGRTVRPPIANSRRRTVGPTLEEKLEKLNKYAPNWKEFVIGLPDMEAIDVAWDMAKDEIAAGSAKQAAPVRRRLKPAEASPTRSPVKSPIRRGLSQQYKNKVAILDDKNEDWRSFLTIKKGESETDYIDRALEELVLAREEEEADSPVITPVRTRIAGRRSRG